MLFISGCCTKTIHPLSPCFEIENLNKFSTKMLNSICARDLESFCKLQNEDHQEWCINNGEHFFEVHSDACQLYFLDFEYLQGTKGAIVFVYFSFHNSDERVYYCMFYYQDGEFSIMQNLREV